MADGAVAVGAREKPGALDLGRLERAVVVEVLGYVESTIAHTIKHARSSLRPAARVLLQADDLRAIGQLAALTAAVRFDPSKGATLKTWVRFKTRVAMLEEARRANASTAREYVRTRPGACGDEDVEVDYADADAPTPEQTVLDRQACEAVLRHLHYLTPREQILVSRRLAGDDDTDAELARGFGVSRSQICRGMASAIETLEASLKQAPKDMLCR